MGTLYCSGWPLLGSNENPILVVCDIIIELELNAGIVGYWFEWVVCGLDSLIFEFCTCFAIYCRFLSFRTGGMCPVPLGQLLGQ